MYCEKGFLFESVFKWKKIMNGRTQRLKLNHSPTFDEILCYENIHLH